ncbi:MAG: DUF4382 domain-containing protein [Anaerolineae bacterium]
MKKRTNSNLVGKLILCVSMLSLFLVGCQSAETGSLDVVANGEDFVREGFVSVDGWAVEFDQLLVSLDNITVWRSESPYDASDGQPPEGESITLEENYVIDLAAGDSSADPILVDSLNDIPTGHYNAISWDVVAADGQPPVQLSGQGSKDGETVAFDLTIETPFAYSCGEFIGDERKGFVNADQTGDIEMTFHLDHVFGDFDAPADESLNQGALGFGPLAEIAENGQLTANLAMLEQQLSADNYARLIDTLQTLGHVGEGHCYETNGGYSGDK